MCDRLIRVEELLFFAMDPPRRRAEGCDGLDADHGNERRPGVPVGPGATRFTCRGSSPDGVREIFQERTERVNRQMVFV